MIPNITRGEKMYGLVSYLFGPGKENEHENPRVVGGDADTFLIYGGRVLDGAEQAQLSRDLTLAQRTTGTRVSVNRRSVNASTGVATIERAPANVWHCSLSLRAGDKAVTDEEWGQIARDFVSEMGFTEDSGKAPCSWVAVNHGLSKNGNAHIHIAVELVRRDGTKASTHNDFSRAQKIARELEVKYGLERTEDRAAELGSRGVVPAAREAAASRGALEPDAVRLARLVRASAATAADEAEFVRRARRSGLLIRPRFAQGRDDVVEGYSVALRPKPGLPVVWHGGGKVARDLTLPRLRADWAEGLEPAQAVLASQAAIAEWRAAYRNEPMAAPGPEMTEPDPELWASYTKDMQGLREKLRAVPLEDRSTWAVVARETSGVFAAWSQRLEVTPGPLAEVSAELARTAQIKAHAVRPRPVNLVRPGSTAMLARLVTSKTNSPAQLLLLMRQLGETSEAISSMVRARGDARRAAEGAALLRANLGAVTATLQAQAVLPDWKTRDAWPAPLSRELEQTKPLPGDSAELPEWKRRGLRPAPSEQPDRPPADSAELPDWKTRAARPTQPSPQQIKPTEQQGRPQRPGEDTHGGTTPELGR